jgi:hypothetical protein
MRRIHISFLLLLFLFPGLCHAQQVFSDEHADYLILLTLKNFWGKARLSTGEVVQPKDEKERRMVPIPDKEAVRVVRAATPAGLAMWCGVPWQSYYEAFMKSERSKPWSDKQLAFIGMLFGVAQGSLAKSVSRSPCKPRDRDGVTRLLEKRDF